jgi:hypothetical protein
MLISEVDAEADVDPVEQPPPLPPELFPSRDLTTLVRRGELLPAAGYGTGDLEPIRDLRNPHPQPGLMKRLSFLADLGLCRLARFVALSGRCSTLEIRKGIAHGSAGGANR